jgi:hypothetical protein
LLPRLPHSESHEVLTFRGHKLSKRQADEPIAHIADQPARATFLGSEALSRVFSRRISAVGSDNVDVANHISTSSERSDERRSGSRVTQQQMSDQSALKSKKTGAHGAMSQQSSDSGRGTQSTPQKLVQLVGYRDPKSCGESWVSPRLPAHR